MQIETARLYLEILGYTAGIISILFLALQSRKERKLQEFQLLQSLEEKFTDLLWRGDENKAISDIWRPFSPEKNAEFQKMIESKDGREWPLWNSLDENGQDCYRFTRSGLSVMEQAYLVHKQNWISNCEIWEKWHSWMISWKHTNPYLPFVLEEVSGWYTSSFVEYFKKLPNKSVEQVSETDSVIQLAS